MPDLQILIVDDEPLARARLRRLLAGEPGCTVVGEAGDAAMARELIADTQPNCLLLDIAMPGLTGLQLAAMPGLPPVIFVTAYAEHAVEAFEVRAVDYLLKPVARSRLMQALARARRELSLVPEQFVPVRSTHRGRHHVFNACTILRFYASQKYTGFIIDGHEHLSEVSLAQLEEALTPHGYVRVHRGELIRLDAITALHSRPAEVELCDGQRVAVSRRRLPDLRRLLGQ